MKHVALFAALSMFLLACASKPKVSATPIQQREALCRYLDGVSTADIARQMSMNPEDTRALLHTSILELNRKYYGRR